MSASAGQAIGLVAALGGAAAALSVRAPRARLAAMALAQAAAFALILGQTWSTARLASLRGHPPLALAAAVALAAAIAALALAFRRWTWAFPVTALLLLPLRVPIAVGGQTSSLLIPLYLVIAAATLASFGRTPGGTEVEAGRASLVWLPRLLAGTLALYAIQALYSLDVRNAVENATFFLVPFAVLFVLLTEVNWSRDLLRRALIAVAGLSLVLAAIGIGEFATRSLLLNQDLRAENAVHIYFRVNSVFRDPNIFGRYLALTIVALGGYIAWEGRRARGLLAAGAAALLLLALAFSFSLTSFAALLTGLLVILWACLGPRWAAAAVGAALIGGVIYVGAFGSGGTEVSSGGAGRTSLIRGGIDLARERAIWGWGSGSFGEAFYTRIERAKTVTSHDTPIAVAAEQGIIGLAAYGALVLAALATLLGGGVRGSPARVAIAALFVAMLIHTLGYASFLEDPATWAILAVGLALARAAPAIEAAPG